MGFVLRSIVTAVVFVAVGLFAPALLEPAPSPSALLGSGPSPSALSGGAPSVSLPSPWAFLSLAPPASAQAPFLPSAWIQQGRRLQGDNIVFCVDARDPLAEFHEAVGEFIASSLLLIADFYRFDREMDGLVTGDELYLRLKNDCNVFLGYETAPHSDWYPSWMHMTRSYYKGNYVLAALPPTASLQRLDGKRIGSVLGSPGDLQFLRMTQKTPRAQRWIRIPYSTEHLLLQQLLDGAVDAAFIWEPALLPVEADIRIMNVRAIPKVEWAVGAVVLAEDAFLRNMLDQAIAQLLRDGDVQYLMEQLGVPGRPASL